MKACIPYPYTVRYMEAGKENPTTTTRVDHVSGDVPEIGASEVTKVACWGPPLLEEEREECVAWSDSLYVPVKGGKRHLFDLPRSPYDRFPNRDHGFAILGRNRLSKREEIVAEEAFQGKPAKGSRALYGVVDSNLEQNRRIARKCLEGLLRIEGAVWMRVPSVSIKVRPAPWENGALVSVETGAVGFDAVGPGIDEPFFETELRTRHFALSEMDRVRRLTLPGGPAFLVRDLVSLAEEPNPIDAEQDYLARTLRYTLHKTWGDVGFMQRDILQDWLEMRNAYEGYATNGDAIPAHLAEVLRRFVPSIRNERVRNNLGEALVIVDQFETEREVLAPSGPALR